MYLSIIYLGSTVIANASTAVVGSVATAATAVGIVAENAKNATQGKSKSIHSSIFYLYL